MVISSEVVLIIIVHLVVLSSKHFVGSLSLVLIFGHEWSFHLKVQFFFWNILQVVVREPVIVGGLGSTNGVSKSGSLCGVSIVSGSNISGFGSLESLLSGDNASGFSFRWDERSVRLVILNVRVALWETGIS